VSKLASTLRPIVLNRYAKRDIAEVNLGVPGGFFRENVSSMNISMNNIKI